MPALQVKECPTAVYERLRECANRENRSISQQALTIIEGYLGFRDMGEFSDLDDPKGPSGSSRRPKGGYLAERERVFERISKLRPLPVTKKLPDSAELLAQVREEDAR